MRLQKAVEKIFPIRFKLTAIVIQVEVSLHILPTIAEHHIHTYILWGLATTDVL